jgi:RNA polymerase sigma-70 factor (ECF subfamily)
VTRRRFWPSLAPHLPAEARLSPLVPIYLEKREALVRFFTARLGSPAAAEDLVQDIYLKLSGLDPATPVQNEAAFLYRLGSNLMLDRLRQQRRAAARDGHWREVNTTVVEGEEVADEPAADDAVAGRERLRLMLAAIEELPPQQRQAFRLHKLEALSQAETAAALGCSVSSVEKYVRAALKHLVARLG